MCACVRACVRACVCVLQIVAPTLVFTHQTAEVAQLPWMSPWVVPWMSRPGAALPVTPTHFDQPNSEGLPESGHWRRSDLSDT